MPQQKIEVKLSLEQISHLLIENLAQALELNVNEIKPEIPFQNYGLDSIMGIQFVENLSQHFPDTLSPMDLYRYSTVANLAEYIFTRYASIPDHEVISTAPSVDIHSLNEEQVNELIKKELSEIDELLSV